jgi:twitching motility protein PilT
VRNAIRTGKIESIDSAIQSGRAEGMFTLDTDLRRLMEAGHITAETAKAYASDPQEFAMR